MTARVVGGMVSLADGTVIEDGVIVPMGGETQGPPGPQLCRPVRRHADPRQHRGAP